MSVILLQAAAAACYGGLAWTRWRHQVAAARVPRPSWLHMLLLLALLLHGASLGSQVFVGHYMRFGFAEALSMICWLAVATLWIESWYARLDGLQLLALPLAAIGALLPAVVPGQHILANAASPLFRLHFLMAMFAYSLFMLAALHAFLMMAMDRGLHRGHLSMLFTQLPPLLTMEMLLFRIIRVAFVLLSITLVSGLWFSEEVFGKSLSWSHKTVFALLSWLIFAGLLLGRHVWGWRGKRALRWTLAGFIALFLAYIGTRFVLEFILGRN